MLGTRALLMVDGGAPKGVAVGDTFQGVKVVSTSSDSAVVEVGGKRLTLRLGDSPASVGGRGSASSGRIVLPADHGGHFFGQGSINGQAAQFMVDTGASTVSHRCQRRRAHGTELPQRPLRATSAPRMEPRRAGG